ncbi:MAG: prephenate dehydrogenase/arogenate dehydrogenase family protein [Chlorobiaceae bacterium]|nr:prephenate dehydrogenase/arogenate dehydrogenase family protein [Chlorobiaceae bacterium]
MQLTHIRRISFAGLGLIGTSIMQALRKAAAESGKAIELVGWDPCFDEGDIALITGQLGLDRFEPEPAKLYDADVIVLCAPVKANIAMLETVRLHAPAGTLVTDVSSTKQLIAERAAELGLDFIGMHPIAGREQQGYLAASPELLAGRLLIVCSGDSLPETGHAAEFIGLLNAAGCIPAAMRPDKHDRAYANISHLPQLISTLLTTHCRENISRSGPGFSSVSRLAGSAWPIWRDIIETNAANIADELDAFSAILARAAADVRELQLDAIAGSFGEANRIYQSLQQGGRP